MCGAWPAPHFSSTHLPNEEDIKEINRSEGRYSATACKAGPGTDEHLPRQDFGSAGSMTSRRAPPSAPRHDIQRNFFARSTVAVARSAVLAAAMTLVDCSALDPYPTYPQQPEAGVKDAGPRVAICYDVLASSRETVRKAAQDECGPGTAASRVDTDWKLDYCSLLLPARATFVCKPKK